MTTRDDVAQAPSRTVDWGKALVAGLVATVVITVTMALFGQNIMKMIGGMIAPGAGTGTQYLLGGGMHLAVGLVYGLLYAWLLGPVRSHGKVIKGLLYAVALTGIALAAMPAMGAMMGGSGAGGPCTPCGPEGTTASAMNPCNPCNPCTPGQGAKAASPCTPCGGGGPCAPCGGAGAPWAGLVSLLNHVFYGLALALIYER